MSDEGFERMELGDRKYYEALLERCFGGVVNLEDYEHDGDRYEGGVMVVHPQRLCGYFVFTSIKRMDHDELEAVAKVAREQDVKRGRRISRSHIDEDTRTAVYLWRKDGGRK